MKKFLSFLCLMTLFLSANATDLYFADPTIYCEDGVFYLTGTYSADGFAMYSSTDLVHWTSCGNATSGMAFKSGDSYGTSGFWAPQIFKYDGSYYMAYTANEQIAIAKSDSPAGPFKQTTKACLPGTTGQIDPFVFIDDDGTKYIYYVRFIGGNTLYCAELTDDFQSIKDGTVNKCLGAEDGWELTGNYSSTPITEGPTMFKDGSYYYLIYSANAYQDIDYAVGYAYSTSPKGPWTKVGHPFISRHNIGINGTGHGDLFQDADGNWYYVFHTHNSNAQVQTRRTAVVPITITDDPTNKFVPQTDRLLMLSSDASTSTKFPASAVAFEKDGIQYSVSNKSKRYLQVCFKDAVLFGGYEGEIVIPDTLEYDGTEYYVKGINTSAFYQCQDLKKVTLPSDLTKIGVGAFENCGICSIEMPGTITSISYLAFKDCNNLLDVVMDKPTALNVGAETFADVTLTDGKLWIPEGSEDAYQSKSPWNRFARISGVETGSKKYDFLADGVYYKVVSESEASVKTSTQTNQWATYRGPEVIVPAKVGNEGKDYDVTAIGTGTFYDSRLVESVKLPEGITEIGTSAFYNCLELRELTIPSTVTLMASTICRNCEKLQSVTCYASVPPTATDNDFPDAAYEGTLYVPQGTKSLYADAICWKNFKNIVEVEVSGIENVTERKNSNNNLYNITGLKVCRNYHGLVIRNGRKYLQK